MPATQGPLMPSLQRNHTSRAAYTFGMLMFVLLLIAGLQTWQWESLRTEQQRRKAKKRDALGIDQHEGTNAVRASAQGGQQGVDVRDPKRPTEAFRPGKAWLDDEGHLIQAHGGGVLWHEGVYYWFGEQKAGPTYTRFSKAYSPPRVDVIGVSCYSSRDLLHWHNEGLALKAGDHPDLHKSNVVERPKDDPPASALKCNLPSRESGVFVMWMHVDTADYEWARLGVAVAKSVTGPYRFLRSFRPHRQEARDLTVFKDDDGSAYVAYSSEDNSVMHVARLTADYTDVQPAYRRILVQLKREAPAIFKHGRYYLMLTSGCTGWAPNRAEVYYAEDMMGVWKPLGNPAVGGDENDRAFCFFSQPTFVVPVNGKPGRYVFMADQWNTADLGASRYVWLPMWVEDVPQDELAANIRRWERDKRKHIKDGGSVLYTVQPGPVQVAVKWLEEWGLEVLDSKLDDETRALQRTEMREYPPGVGLDPLNLLGGGNRTQPLRR